MSGLSVSLNPGKADLMESATLRNGPVEESLVNSPEAMRSSKVMLFLFFFLSLLAPSFPPAAFVKTSLPPLGVRLVLARLDDDDAKLEEEEEEVDDDVVVALPNDRPLFARICCRRLTATTRDDDADEDDDVGQQQDDARIVVDSLCLFCLFLCLCARRARTLWF